MREERTGRWQCLGCILLPWQSGYISWTVHYKSRACYTVWVNSRKTPHKWGSLWSLHPQVPPMHTHPATNFCPHGGGDIWSQEVPEPPFCSLSQVRPQGSSLALAPRLLRGLFICEIACVLLVSGRSACLMLMSL